MKICLCEIHSKAFEVMIRQVPVEGSQESGVLSWGRYAKIPAIQYGSLIWDRPLGKLTTYSEHLSYVAGYFSENAEIRPPSADPVEHLTYPTIRLALPMNGIKVQDRFCLTASLTTQLQPVQCGPWSWVLCKPAAMVRSMAQETMCHDPTSFKSETCQS